MLPFSKRGNSREEVLAWSKRNCDFRLNFKSLLIGSKTSLLIERGTITNRFSSNKFKEQRVPRAVINTKVSLDGSLKKH